MTEKDHIGPDPIKWLDRLIEVNAGSSFEPTARAYINACLRRLQGDLRDLRTHITEHKNRPSAP